MKKDKEWLKDEVRTLFDMASILGKMEYHESEESIDRINSLIDQLDEPEVKQLDEKIKELDSYNDELIRDNNQLRNELNNQEVLSQEFIDEHEQCITGHGADKNGMSQYHHAPFVSVYDLQNLLVPKQNKPVIPQFVADWIEVEKAGYTDKYLILEMFMCEYNAIELPNDLYNYYDNNNGNSRDKVINAILYGYEVEKEPLYYVKLPVKLWNINAYELEEYSMFLALKVDSDETKFVLSANGNGNYRTDLTEAQIKAIDERYLAFAEEVVE